MDDTFCILPWKQLIVRSNGTCQICNRINSHISINNHPLSIQNHALEEIWNSDDLRGIREKMVNGERVPACSECYELEKAGSISMRRTMNQIWKEGFLNEQGENVEKVEDDARMNSFRHPAPPSFVELDVGSLCNLKCRMCHGGASSQISRDPVHNRWAGIGLDLSRQDWFKRGEVIQNILRYPDQIQQLHIIGGEPFLIEEVGSLLQVLIDAGVAHNIDLSLHTNATTTRCSWLPLTGEFRKLSLWFSIDGFGKYYEYIRYPARWNVVSANIESLRRLPNVESEAHVVFQVYNALNAVDLFTYFDEIDLPFFPHLLHEPLYLRVTAMPPVGRQLAVQRLRSYLRDRCRPRHQERIASLIAYLDNAPDAFDFRIARQLMLFTNDLDVSRGQRFADTHAELLGLMLESGVPWTTETWHAPPFRGGH